MTLTVAPFDKVRARRLPAEQRREHLLDVGAAIILDSGFETLTMESVAERAGVSKGLGYAYFENAEELALALYDREMAEFYRRILEATAGVESFEPFVARLATDVVPVAQLRHRIERQPLIPNESFSLFHGYCLQPGHRPTSVGPQRKVLPMFPV